MMVLHTCSECPSEVFCTRFSPDGKLLAAGCGDGAIRVRHFCLSFFLMTVECSTLFCDATGV